MTDATNGPSPTTESTLDQADWNDVYYDQYAGNFALIDVQDDTVVLRNPFTGDQFHEFTPDEFRDRADDGDFQRIHPAVLANPSETILNAIIAAKAAHDGDTGPARDLDAHEVEFARRCVSLDTKDGLAWQDHIDH